MRTLVIYDGQGKVVFTNTNPDVQEGEFNPLVVTVPEGKMLIGVNIETGEPIFSDIPPSEIETLRQRTEDLEVLLTDILIGGF